MVAMLSIDDTTIGGALSVRFPLLPKAIRLLCNGYNNARMNHSTAAILVGYGSL